MPESIDELYSRWQRNPDAARTLAMCDALRGSDRVDLVEIVGSHAARQLDVPSLLAAARMYTDIGRLDEAQQILVAAGRLAPRDAEVYHWLGEVLLRRGDAERAEKVLDRAVQFRPEGAAHKRLLDVARSLLPVQRSSGMTAAATEARRLLATPSRHARSPFDELETGIHGGGEIEAALANLGGGAGGTHPFGGPPPPARPAAPPARPVQTAGVALPPRAAGAAVSDGGTFPFGAPAPASTDAPAPPVPPAYRAPQGLLGAPLPAPAAPADTSIPEARDVLEALQIAGVFEPEGAVRPVMTWDAPEPGRRRIKSLVTLTALAVVTVGVGVGAYVFVQNKRAKEHVEAERILAQVDADLAAGDAAKLDPSEKALARVFDLESRSSHAALTWVHERAALGLLKGGENVAFEDATQRAKEVGVPEGKLAFAAVASFLFQGDTAGAAAAIAKWDAVAHDDPWFQLVAGAAFDRAGDPRSVERFAAAQKLDPSLFLAQMFLVRAQAFDGNTSEAMALARAMHAASPARLEGSALYALAWARDPARGETPAEVKEIADKADALPLPLKAVPHASAALLALEHHDRDGARAAVQRGLAVADSPGVAAWLGNVALGIGDEALARKAALAAVSYSAVYAPARVLAARVALLGGRLDEALKAAEDLPPASPEVAVVTAAVAYEKVDGERLAHAFDDVPGDARKLPLVAPLSRAQSLLSGTLAPLTTATALAMANDDAPWSDLVAMDTALAAGDLDLAQAIATAWGGGEAKPLRALRLARLARWQGKLDEADRLSRVALEGGSVTLRTLEERALTLVASGKAHDALALFKSYPKVGGPVATWLRAFVIASGGGKMDEARAALAQEDPPPALAPMPARIIAALTYGAVKDTRHGSDYVKPILQAGFTNPDVAAAAAALGASGPRKAAKRR